jgi:hypothetical protein
VPKRRNISVRPESNPSPVSNLDCRAFNGFFARPSNDQGDRCCKTLSAYKRLSLLGRAPESPLERVMGLNPAKRALLAKGKLIAGKIYVCNRINSIKIFRFSIASIKRILGFITNVDFCNKQGDQIGRIFDYWANILVEKLFRKWQK